MVFLRARRALSSHAIRAALLIFALCCLASRAFAQDQAQRPRVRLALENSVPNCDRRDELVAAIAARLGYSPFSNDATTTMRVRFSVDRTNALHASLALEQNGNASGEREFSSEDQSCVELVEAIALTATIAIDPAALTRNAQEPTPTASAQNAEEAQLVNETPPPVQRIADDDANDENAEAQSAWHMAATLGAMGAYGTAPMVSPGIAAQLELRYRAFVVQLGGRYDFGGRKDVGAGHVHASMGAADLGVCGRYSWFYACGVGVFGAIDVGAVDLPDGTSVQNPYVALGGRAGLDVELTPQWALRVQLDMGAPLMRTRYWAGSVQTWRTPPVFGALMLAAVLNFL